MTERKKGLYYGSSEDSYRSEKEVKRKLALQGELPSFQDPLPERRDFAYWSNRFIQRSDQHKETSPIKDNHVVVRLPNPTLINFMGDTHAGAVETDHRRIEQEAELVEHTPNSFLILGGDLIEGFFFNPAQMEQAEQTPEQIAYAKALIEKLGERRKLLAGWIGDHDNWMKKRGSSMYDDFIEKAKAPLFHGVGHMTLQVGESEVKLTAAHKLPGHSIYNAAHPAARASREIQGADVYVNFHTHSKGHLEQPIKTHGDDARTVHAISLGPYKSHDEYTRKHGWARQTTPDELYGASIEIEEVDGKFEITYHRDIVTAHRKFVGQENHQRNNYGSVGDEVV